MRPVRSRRRERDGRRLQRVRGHAGRPGRLELRGDADERGRGRRPVRDEDLAGPPAPLPIEDRKCQDAIGKAGGKYFAARHGAIAGCYAALLAGKPIFEDPGHSVPITDPANCTDELKTAAKIDKGRRALRLAVEKKCSDTILDRLIACSQTVDGLVDPSGASGCLVLSIDAAVSDLLVDEYGL